LELIDNINKLLGDDLKESIGPGARLRVAAACFSIYAFEALKDHLEEVESFDFIFTSPTFVPDEQTDGEAKQRREFHIPRRARERSFYGSEFEIQLKNKLTQRAVARECADWMRRKARFRSNRTKAPMQPFACLEGAGSAVVYPPQAAFDRPVPKSRICSHGRPPPTRRLQQRLTDEVARITWSYKLAPETIRLPARGGVEEIQIFTITLKPGIAGPAAKPIDDLLRCIDRAIPSPIIFEVAAPGGAGAADGPGGVQGGRVRAVAAYKRPSEADAAKWVLGDYFASPWLAAGAPRAPLPVALDLASLYRQLLQRLMPHPPRAGESLKDHTERLGRIRALERESRTLQTRLQREKQFNRKVEINRDLRSLMAQIDEQAAT
jgi:hypothetical protein